MTDAPTLGDDRAVIAYNPEIEMFRGETRGLGCGADFYAADLAGLRRECERSL
jgi:predicted HicB family RNase H-like nuclease